MEDFVNFKIDFEDEQINFLITQLSSCYFSNQGVFAKLCFTIYKIRNYFKDSFYQSKQGDYYNFYSLMQAFGFSKTQACSYRQCYENYCHGDSFADVVVKDYYVRFSPAKLIEMLPLSSKMLEAVIDKKIITPDMTCKQIRQKVKELSGKKESDLVTEDLSQLEEKTEEERLAELPQAFDPKETHSYEYFKQFSKEVLINYLFQCEDYIKKISKKGK